jgi:antitoxin ParD1/3/4
MGRAAQKTARVALNISLTRDLARFVEAKVAGGRYASASEVLRDGLRLLIEQERLRQLRRHEFRKQVQEGLNQARRGEVLDGDVVFDEILREIDEKERLHGKT